MTPGKVYWLAAFPKAGSTWMRTLIHNLLLGGPQPADINDVKGAGGYPPAPDAMEVHTLLEPGLLTESELRDLRPGLCEAIAADRPFPPFVRVHDAWGVLADGRPLLGNAMAGALYVVRDPRDVAVSAAHYWDLTLDEAVELMCGRRGRAEPPLLGFRQVPYRTGSWSEHAASWLDQTVIPVHMVRYEDLSGATAAILAAAMAFAGFDAEPAALDRAVRASDFKELRRQEQERGYGGRASSANPFFRQGCVGGWREVLSPRQAGLIAAENLSMMEKLGYDANA
jgi:aryl sulfotransferase